MQGQRKSLVWAALGLKEPWNMQGGTSRQRIVGSQAQEKELG